MTAPATVTVIDIGKTHAKVVLIDRATGTEVDTRQTDSPFRTDGPYPHADTPRLAVFLSDALADVQRTHGVEAIAVTAHGASGAYLSGDDPDAPDGGLALPILDYEFEGPDDLAAGYDRIRPAFSESFSPRLPGGLNLGAQLHWQQDRFADEVGKAHCYVTYPQYWSWWLTGVAATDICSLGCHTDLWNVANGGLSSMVAELGWSDLLAPPISPDKRLGNVRADLAKRLRLADNVPVVCGIHDSSASLLPYRATLPAPFSVVSSGTWTIMLAIGGSLEQLDPERDALAYVAPNGDAVPAARFMGGREFAQMAGEDAPVPSSGDLGRVIGEGIMALPCFTPGVGPFPDAEGRWTQDPSLLSPGERAAAASLNLALVSSVSLDLASADGPSVVEGPLSSNKAYCQALAAITGRPVFPSAVTSGPARGAALLYDPDTPIPDVLTAPVEPLRHEALIHYIMKWREVTDKLQ